MSHPPFEEWIFKMNQMSPDERRTLNAHIDGCEQCRKLQDKWQMVHRELRSMPEVRPAPGFSQRWFSSLSERRAREQRKQAWRAFIWFMGGAFAALLVLVGYAMAVSTPADWLALVIRYASNSLNLFDSGIALVRLWLESTPLALNIAIWMYATVTLCLLSFGWAFALWRTTIIGVFNK
jgi:hypothetical protein